MPGPTPKKDARRRNKRPDWLTLPASGRTGKPPAWPIGRPTKEETALWKQLWSTPQAFAWERLGWTRVVGRYARLVLQSETREATAALLGEVRQMEDRLGLTPMSMKRLQWEVGEVPTQATGGGKASVSVLDEYRDLYAVS